MRGTITLLLIAASSIACPCFASVYQCIGADGHIAYSDVPCGTNAEIVNVQPHATIAPGPVAKKAIPANGAKDDLAWQRIKVEGRGRSRRQAEVVQCTVHNYNEWVHSQTPLPDKEARLAKFKSVGEECRQIYKFTEADASAYRAGPSTGAATLSGRPLAASNSLVNSSADHEVSAGHTEPSSYAPKSGFTILSTTSVRPLEKGRKGYSRGTFFSQLPDGGFLIAGANLLPWDTPGNKTLSTWIQKISGAMHSEWQQVTPDDPQNGGLSFAIPSTDGGYWAVGVAYGKPAEKSGQPGAVPRTQFEQPYDYLSKLGPHGEVLWTHPATDAGEWHGLYCGVEARDGLYLVGTHAQTYVQPDGKTNSIPVPWIEKLDKDGRLLWQKAIPDDGNKILDVTSVETGCGKLTTDDAGRISWAITAYPVPFERKNGQLQITPTDALQLLFDDETVVVQLDPQGNELHRRVSTGAQNAFLMHTAAGYTLIEHFWRKPSGPSNPLVLVLQDKRGVRITDLDEDLKVQKITEHLVPALNDKLRAVLSADDGGYFLAGCNGSAANSIVYLRPDGLVSAPEQVMLGQCGKIGLARGLRKNEIVMFLEIAHSDDSQLLQAKFEPSKSSLSASSESLTEPSRLSSEPSNAVQQDKPALACVAVDQVSNQRTPVDILQGVSQCINSGDYSKAARLYAVAGTFGKYDAERVNDLSASEILGVLNMIAFAGLTREQDEAFKKERLSLKPGSAELHALCASVQNIGPPKYFPSYMIQHGVSSQLNNGASGLRSDFDSNKGWQEALSGFLNCAQQVR
ncbi:MAG: DUF4124 domain-containing protein [Stenotrophobium sp.]